MPDKIFCGLRQADGYGWKWQGRQAIYFGGELCEVDLLVQGMEQSEITERQEDAFRSFLEKWPALQGDLADALVEYYNETERFSYGPENDGAAEEWWPEIETREALLHAVTLETIVVPEDFMMDDGRRIYLLFAKAWGGEDLDDNGIGVCFINESIDEIAYKDIAF